MFPGVILQMCYWYRPDEMSLRLLYFCIFISFSSRSIILLTNRKMPLEISPKLLAEFLHMALTPYLAGAASLDGNGKNRALHFSRRHAHTYRTRIFLVEGVITIAFGMSLWFLLPDCEHLPLSIISPLG
jgi:hypothetical protein